MGRGQPIHGRLTLMLPFGCEAVRIGKFRLYLITVVSSVAAVATHRGQVGSLHRTLPQVYHRPEERIS